MTCPQCKGQQHTNQLIRVIHYVGGTWAKLFKVCGRCKGTGHVAD